jgi:hypothetical protein
VSLLWRGLRISGCMKEVLGCCRTRNDPPRTIELTWGDGPTKREIGIYGSRNVGSSCVQAKEEVRYEKLGCPRPAFGKKGVCWLLRKARCVSVRLVRYVMSPSEAPPFHRLPLPTCRSLGSVATCFG